MLIKFEDFNDREDVLATSRVTKDTGISITEDVSKKVREAQKELKKFLRVVKRNSPDKYCFLQYDKLYIDGKIFVYDEEKEEVVEQSRNEYADDNNKYSILLINGNMCVKFSYF